MLDQDEFCIPITIVSLSFAFQPLIHREKKAKKTKMKKNEMDEQPLSVSPFALQPLVLREKKKKKTVMKKNEMDEEEIEEIRAH